MQKVWQIDETLLESVYGWDQWHGSYYEVSMAYPWLSHQERSGLLQCTWSNDHLLGVVESPDQYGQGWQEPASVDPADANHGYGFIRLADGHLVGCGSYFTSWDDTTWFSLILDQDLRYVLLH